MYCNLYQILAEIDKMILNYICNYEGPRLAKTILKKNEVGNKLKKQKNEVGELTLADIKT